MMNDKISSTISPTIIYDKILTEANYVKDIIEKYCLKKRDILSICIDYIIAKGGDTLKYLEEFVCTNNFRYEIEILVIILSSPERMNVFFSSIERIQAIIGIFPNEEVRIKEGIFFQLYSQTAYGSNFNFDYDFVVMQGLAGLINFFSTQTNKTLKTLQEILSIFILVNNRHKKFFSSLTDIQAAIDMRSPAAEKFIKKFIFSKLMKDAFFDFIIKDGFEKVVHFLLHNKQAIGKNENSLSEKEVFDKILNTVILSDDEFRKVFSSMAEIEAVIRIFPAQKEVLKQKIFGRFLKENEYFISFLKKEGLRKIVDFFCDSSSQEKESRDRKVIGKCFLTASQDDKGHFRYSDEDLQQYREIFPEKKAEFEEYLVSEGLSKYIVHTSTSPQDVDISVLKKIVEVYSDNDEPKREEIMSIIIERFFEDEHQRNLKMHLIKAKVDGLYFLEEIVAFFPPQRRKAIWQCCLAFNCIEGFLLPIVRYRKFISIFNQEASEIVQYLIEKRHKDFVCVNPNETFSIVEEMISSVGKDKDTLFVFKACFKNKDVLKVINDSGKSKEFITAFFSVGENRESEVLACLSEDKIYIGGSTDILLNTYIPRIEEKKGNAADSVSLFFEYKNKRLQEILDSGGLLPEISLSIISSKTDSDKYMDILFNLVNEFYENKDEIFAYLLQHTECVNKFLKEEAGLQALSTLFPEKQEEVLDFLGKDSDGAQRFFDSVDGIKKIISIFSEKKEKILALCLSQEDFFTNLLFSDEEGESIFDQDRVKEEARERICDKAIKFITAFYDKSAKTQKKAFSEFMKYIKEEEDSMGEIFCTIPFICSIKRIPLLSEEIATSYFSSYKIFYFLANTMHESQRTLAVLAKMFPDKKNLMRLNYITYCAVKEKGLGYSTSIGEILRESDASTWEMYAVFLDDMIIKLTPGRRTQKEAEKFGTIEDSYNSTLLAFLKEALSDISKKALPLQGNNTCILFSPNKKRPIQEVNGDNASLPNKYQRH